MDMEELESTGKLLLDFLDEFWSQIKCDRVDYVDRSLGDVFSVRVFSVSLQLQDLVTKQKAQTCFYCNIWSEQY